MMENLDSNSEQKRNGDIKLKYQIDDLVKMMGYNRPAFSHGEEEFIAKYIDKVPGMRKDKFGNRYISIGNHDTMFTAHTDTVHRWSKGTRQKVYVKGGFAYTSGYDVLGADDTVGCFILLNMIYAGVPGLYFFFRDEEHGGNGSSYVANNKVPKNIKKVVSFDRKGYTDVITHQGWTQTASDEFAKALARALGRGYQPSDNGTFTDSANFEGIVPECTNISIGYKDAHTRREMQDLRFASWLSQKAIQLNWKKLPVKRNPFEDNYVGWWGKQNKSTKKKSSYGKLQQTKETDGVDWMPEPLWPKSTTRKDSKPEPYTPELVSFNPKYNTKYKKSKRKKSDYSSEWWLW